MKRILLLACLVIAGCEANPQVSRNSDGKQQIGFYPLHSYSITEFTYQGCEYVVVAGGGTAQMMAHKGNCRACERRMKELLGKVK
jgi:hypothetical protein